ncbi:growth factor receptor-bound protein 14 isoform X4 [Caretta caretta]|uniref:growth factor receptor-bound protein 14 isoform X4 n=1 Tax=Caretta caretta TaxID=8467 RepID=UPI003F4C1C14
MAAPLPHLPRSAGRAAETPAPSQESSGDLAPSPWLAQRAPLLPPAVPHSQAGPRLGPDRIKKKERDVLAIPSIPNPFPELCCSPLSSVLSASLLPKATSRKKQVIKVYSEDDTSRALEVPGDVTARDVCQLLILKNHYIDDHSWTLFEHLPRIGLERMIEDHELVIEVQSNWGIEEENRLYFRKNYAKYEFFKHPMNYFPEHMVSLSSETSGMIGHAQILQMFLSSSTYPEIHGYLHAKEQGKKSSWKKLYFLLRRSGLYFSTKGTSKEPRHLQFFSEFSSSDMYMSLAGKKTSGTPANYGFCFKRKGCLRLNTHGSPTTSQSATSSVAIHRTQLWFHHKISRDEAQRLILQQGLVDGVFLVRDSQSNPKTFVLSMSHGLKIKHFQIVPLEDDGKLFYTLDEGHTRFTDLIQLVEFYQLNKGVLPCKLKHYCARIAL